MADAATRAFDAENEARHPTSFPMTDENREEPDEEETVVIWRRWRSGPKSVLAVFPEIVADYQGSMQSYDHVGQHGACNYHGAVLPRTRPANETDPDVAELKAELEHRGYRLRTVKRIRAEMDQKRLDMLRAIR